MSAAPPSGRSAASRAAALLLALLSFSCAAHPPAGRPLRLTTTPAGADTRLTLVASPGVRLNARVKPALELPDGTVLRFDSPHLTSDSAYFTQPPTVLLPGPAQSVRGTLRASICAEDELVCRSISLEI